LSGRKTSAPPCWSYFYDYLSPYLTLIAMLGSVVYLVQLIRVMPSVRLMILPTEESPARRSRSALMSEAHIRPGDGQLRLHGRSATSVVSYLFKLIFMLAIILSPPSCPVLGLHARNCWTVTR